MVLKSSWMVIATIFLGQSSVLAAPVEQISVVNPERSHLFQAEGLPILTDLTHGQGGEDSCENFGTKDSYPKHYSAEKTVGMKDPTYTDDPNNSTTHRVGHSGGESYGKKTIKPGDGTIPGPAFPNDPKSNINNLTGDYYHGKKSTKVADKSISDPTLKEDTDIDTTFPLRNDCDERSWVNLAKGTLADAEGRQDLIPTGEPSIDPSSFPYDVIPNDAENVPCLGIQERSCGSDVMQKAQHLPSISDVGKETHPNTFGNGDDTDRSI